MYPIQTLLLSHKESIDQWLTTYTPNHLPINWNNIENFKIRVPLIGAFSAGKSSLLNRFLDDSLLPLDITPESGIAIEISYANQDQFRAVNAGGVMQTLQAEDLKSADLAQKMVAKEAWLEAELHKPILANMPHITIVDLPGLGSGQDIHSKAIDDYIARSLAYCIVVSAEDGDLTASTQTFLTELAQFKLPVVLVMTKADKRVGSDADAVFHKISQSVERVMGEKPLAGIIASRREKAKLQEELQQAFSLLESRAESVFITHVASKVKEQLLSVRAQLAILLNQEDLTSEELEAKQEEIKKSLQQFRDQVEDETVRLETACADAIPSICNIVQQRLLSQRDSLARAAINQSNLEPMIMPTVRLAITEGIQSQFIPKVERYLARIDANVPADISVNSDFNSSVELDGDTSFPLTQIGATLLPVLSKVFVAIPFANIIAPILSVIASWFTSKQSKEDARRQQFEEACSHITSSVIPQVMSQVNSVVSRYLNEQILKAKEAILEKANEREKELQHTINTLLTQLKESKEEFEQQQATYEADLTEIDQILKSLSTSK